VGRRQLHYACRARSFLEFSLVASGQRAGLVVRADERNHYDLVLAHTERGLRLLLESCVQGERRTLAELPWTRSRAELCIEARQSDYEFFAGDGEGALRQLGRLPSVPLASEVTGGFTGAYFGMFVSGGVETPPADFDYFEYTPLEANA